VTVDAASRGRRRIEVFAQMSDGTIWHNWYDHGTRHGWEWWGNPGYELLEGVEAVVGYGPGVYTCYVGPASFVEPPCSYQDLACPDAGPPPGYGGSGGYGGAPGSNAGGTSGSGGSAGTDAGF